ncbi:MAG: SDR family oxidoreductase [Butyrivibrio sp.]|nr:SDR family oxidoreductase [Butyrivibrio sp.]
MSRVVLITGASSGFGYEFSKIFASKGYDLVLIARSEDRLISIKKKLEKKYSIKVYVLVQDLSLENSGKKVYDYTKDNGLAVDILINNAGFGDYGRFADSSLEKQLQMINLNDRVLTELTHLFLRNMIINKSGKILNVASIASFEAGPMMSVYYASKAYVLSFTESLACELKGTGVTVTALCPGPTETGFTKGAEMPDSRLADSFRFTKASDVARYGYKSLMKGEVIAIPGILNKMGVLAVKFLPRSFVRDIVYRFQQ